MRYFATKTTMYHVCLKDERTPIATFRYQEDAWEWARRYRDKDFVVVSCGFPVPSYSTDAAGIPLSQTLGAQEGPGESVVDERLRSSRFSAVSRWVPIPFLIRKP